MPCLAAGGARGHIPSADPPPKWLRAVAKKQQRLPRDQQVHCVKARHSVPCVSEVVHDVAPVRAKTVDRGPPPPADRGPPPPADRGPPPPILEKEGKDSAWTELRAKRRVSQVVSHNMQLMQEEASVSERAEGDGALDDSGLSSPARRSRSLPARLWSRRSSRRSRWSSDGSQSRPGRVSLFVRNLLQADRGRGKKPEAVHGAVVVDAIRTQAIERQVDALSKAIRNSRYRTLYFLLLWLAYLLVGALLFCWAEGWDFSTAVYFAMVTMTTVGYGDVVPEGGGGRFLAIIYALVGLAVWTRGLVALFSEIKDHAARRVEILMVRARSESAKPRRYRQICSAPHGVFGPWIAMGLWTLIFTALQLGCAAIFHAAVPSVGYWDFAFHCMSTSLTVGYGDVANRLPRTPEIRALTTVHISLSVFWLAAMLADLERAAGREKARRKQTELLGARLDGELIPTFDRNGDGVDRIEYVIGMLTHMGVLSWSDVQPFLDQFDAMDVDGSGHLDRADLERMAEMQAAAARREKAHAMGTHGSALYAAMAIVGLHKKRAELKRAESKMKRGASSAVLVLSELSRRPSGLGPAAVASGSKVDGHEVDVPQGGAGV